MSILLAALMVGACVPASVLAAPQSRLLLLYPVVDGTEQKYPDVARQLTEALQIAMDGVAGLRVAEFSKTSPMVQRAVKEGQIRSVDVEADVTDAFAAIQIGSALGVNEVCVATLTAVKVGGDPRQVEVVLSGQVWPVQRNMDAASGQVVDRPVMSNSFAVSGAGTAREGYRGEDGPLFGEAIRSAASKAATVLAGRPAAPTTQARGKSRTNAWKWIVTGLIVAGLAMAANSGTDHEAVGPSPQATAPTPLRIVPEASAIRLYWTAPANTSLTLLRYQIRRSTDNGRTWSLIDEGNVGPAATDFADFEVAGGTTYRYQIRAQYTSVGASAWVEFQAIEFPG